MERSTGNLESGASIVTVAFPGAAAVASQIEGSSRDLESGASMVTVVRNGKIFGRGRSPIVGVHLNDYCRFTFVRDFHFHFNYFTAQK